MKLRRLRVEHFAGIVDGVVEFGPGLNVLYGPNDLGKSSVADAIRLVLLLPHGSSSREPYIPWSGAYEPVVELEFETGPDDIWSVKKEFGKRGSSWLRWSKNGRDFDDKEKGRAVDGRLRELLRWGIAEPGGAGAPKGLPSSFLATALLSTQSGVGDVLHAHLGRDQTLDGKDRLAAALQAAAQDPMFTDVLDKTQARRDQAWTPAGARKTGRDSVFRIPSQNVTDRRRERDEWKKTVESSAGIESELLRLIALRDVEAARVEESRAAADAAAKSLRDGARRAEAEVSVARARADVARIRGLAAAVEQFDREALALVERRDAAIQSLAAAIESVATALREKRLADERLRASEGTNDAVAARRDAEVRSLTAAQLVASLRVRVDAAQAAVALCDAEETARAAFYAEKSNADAARQVADKARELLDAAKADVASCDLLARALSVRDALAAVASADAVLAERAALLTRMSTVRAQLAAAEARRAAVVLPPKEVWPALRRLATELATARGALQVGLVLTVSPLRAVDVAVGIDGAPSVSSQLDQQATFSADGEMELLLRDVARIRVVGGHRDAHEKVAALEERWATEALPHLVAAGVSDLEALEARAADAIELDGEVARERESEGRLVAELDRRADAEQRRAAAADVAFDAAAALGRPIEPLLAELAELGTDAARSIAGRRARAAHAIDVATGATAGAALATAIERAEGKRLRWQECLAAKDTVMASHPEGPVVALAAARDELARAEAVARQAADDLTRLDADVATVTRVLASSVEAATQRVAAAHADEASKRAVLGEIETALAAIEGKRELQRQHRDAEDLGAAEAALDSELASLDKLPLPSRHVSADEVERLERDTTTAAVALREIETEIDMKRGALAQVAGNIAQERLADAEEALSLALRHERAVEADYEAWKLLLEQLKEADAAQSSNLGHALAPSVGKAFAALTARKYQGISLDANLRTDGVVVGSATRDPGRLSVGTREQLSTLYRLSLAETLGSAVVLDDQLVQSDALRMEWFRRLLLEKARVFQIVVMTCRPGDYLSAFELAEEGVFRDSQDGAVRAVDMQRALGRAR